MKRFLLLCQEVVLTLTLAVWFFYSLGMQCCSLVYAAEYIYLFLYVSRISPPQKKFFSLIIRIEEFDPLIIVMFGKND